MIRRRRIVKDEYMISRSPWLVQLKRSRPIQKIIDQKHHDIIIVGGGIAGVITAYYLLRQTTCTVLLLEAYEIAHGATGHNAGQVVSYFERSLMDIAKEFGQDLTIDAYRDLNNTWSLIEELYTTVRPRAHLTQVTGYAGYATTSQVLAHLSHLQFLADSNIPTELLQVAEHSTVGDHIPAQYNKLYTLVPHATILENIQSTDHQFIAAGPERKGCVNSSLLTEELVGFLLKTYPERFQLAEHKQVKKITYVGSTVTVMSTDQRFTASTVVLCTNGYSTFAMEPDDMIRMNGTIGYMSGYLNAEVTHAAAIRYFTADHHHATDPYFYITKRSYEHGRHAHTLLCVGGPEVALPGSQQYDPKETYLPTAHQDLEHFLLKSYHRPPMRQKPDFQWHGLMGYTSNLIRLIGPHPKNHAIIYNLGCNGVGILPSIYGGKRIARFIEKDDLPPSIFDPAVQLHK
jgi:glycine/D-amino acid oxidase-like deaminating enzyme